ncbi:MAG: peptidoglycan DD-metalloendopeptidase family protein [Aminipila sp.]
MNERIRNTINTIKDKLISEKVKEATRNFTKQQKQVALGVVGVLALATVLSVTPMVYTGTNVSADYGKAAQQKNIAAAQETQEPQWLISIGGQLVLAVATEEDAKNVFEGVKSYYLADNSEVTDVTFDREFRWDSYDYKALGGKPAWVMNVDDAIDYILKGTATPKTYQVVGGDTVWDIAVKNGISLEELEAMNPGISTEKLMIGSVINLYESKPFINVMTTETMVATNSIPYETTYEESASLYRGQSKVKVAGVEGSKETKAQVVKQNGVVVATTVLEEKVISQPQNQVSLKGTGALPVYTASVSTTKSSGALAAPMSHIEVSSGYGASRGSRRHAGIDLRNPKGTPFAAAADGVVVYSGYSGSYGNIIKVDHGGGLQTYYAHCDSMNVSVGETVSKGQTLGTVGSTGNATGNVLHFEVRINGAAQNPMNYI